MSTTLETPIDAAIDDGGDTTVTLAGPWLASIRARAARVVDWFRALHLSRRQRLVLLIAGALPAVLVSVMVGVGVQYLYFDRTGLPDPLVMSFQIKAVDGKVTKLTCRLAER